MLPRRVRADAAPRSLATASAVALVLALAMGCGTSEEATPPEPPPTPPTAPPSDPVPEAVPEPGPPTDTGRAPNTCDAPTAEGIVATVSAQLAAFAADDLAGAYAMTSPFFRRFHDEEGFAALIRDEYPELLGNDGYRTDTCLAVGRRGSLVVGVRDGARELVLRYDLSEEEDGWRIDGARRLTGVVLPPQPLA